MLLFLLLLHVAVGEGYDAKPVTGPLCPDRIDVSAAVMESPASRRRVDAVVLVRPTTCRRSIYAVVMMRPTACRRCIYAVVLEQPTA